MHESNYFQFDAKVRKVKVQLEVIFMLYSGEEDLCEVRQELTGIAAQWKDIGIDLGIAIGKLNEIQAEVEGSMQCLTQMLITWLRRAYNVERFGEPTWRKLVEVVGSPSGGNNPSLSRSIAERHQAESDSAGEILNIDLLICCV